MPKHKNDKMFNPQNTKAAQKRLVDLETAEEFAGDKVITEQDKKNLKYEPKNNQ